MPFGVNLMRSPVSRQAAQGNDQNQTKLELKQMPQQERAQAFIHHALRGPQHHQKEANLVAA